MTKVASFEIHYSRFLDPAGTAVAELPAFARDPKALIPLYRGMVLTRRFDAKAVALQRTGRLGTYASSLGQEAVTVGLAAAMLPEDVLLPTYREAGAQLWRGVRMDELLLYWGGDERGSDFQGPRGDFPVCVPIASQCLHAVGVAYAKKLKREPRRGGLRLRRRRDLERRLLRGDQLCRRLARAGGVRDQQQSVGDLDAARGADRGRHAGAEGDRRRHSRRCRSTATT